ncbi:response regulator [Lysinibacter cavernae]|uniref:DNA-binding NarL/FixJ family response regulator n=1 Tax=Lysinibacter cavernae TaxID=1640652 RepID=A0A7X5QYY7_9MICO|nr:DNA-binding NarL/FixJ family response regulator [Lysinibacter cavernae]
MSTPVFIVDDQASIRAALRDLVRGDPLLRDAGEAANGAAAVAHFCGAHALGSAAPGSEQQDAAAIVLMDIRMPALDGIEATKRILERRTDVRVIILTTFDHDEYVYEALRAGASGFLLKNAPAADIVRAIHAVRDGEAMLAPEVTRRLLTDFAARPPQALSLATEFDGLTEREQEVVRAIATGLSNDEIAAHLFLSRATVKTYLSRLFLKLGVRDRTQLVILAYETGFIRLS